MYKNQTKWKQKRKSKIKEYILISHILSILLMGLLLLKMFMNLKFGIFTFNAIILPPFFMVLYVFSTNMKKSHINEEPSFKSYFIFAVLAITITSLIYFNIDLNDINNTNRHFYKIYYFIPIILYTVNYGQSYGHFAAIFSSINLISLNIFLGDFSNLDLDIIIIMIFFWVAWLIGGYTDLERKVQKKLENLAANLKQANLNLRESQKLFRLNFDEAHIGMIIADIEGNIIKANKAISNMLGYSKQELKDVNVKKIVHRDDLKKCLKVCAGMKRGKINTANDELRYIDKDGNTVWTNHNVTLVRDHDDSPLYYLNQIENITRKKEYEEEMKKQREMLEYNELKTKFFAKLSHELKTPLNLIFTSLQIIYTNKDDYLKEEQKFRFNKYLNLIKQNSYRLLRLVNNVIDLTKIDTDSFELNLGEYDIVSLVKEITLSTEDYVENHQRSLEFYSETDEKIIECDPFSIERIILNLISNAVKFTDEGDRIFVNIYDQGNSVLLTVRDTGIGIKEEMKDVIFEQFRQVDESFARRSEGSGIGLSIVKSLVELHGGRIWVESKPGIGSEFFVKLPVENTSDNGNNNEYVPDNLIDKINIEFSDIYDV